MIDIEFSLWSENHQLFFIWNGYIECHYGSEGAD